MPDQGHFLTTTQAAEFLNISSATLKKFIAAGRIKTFRTPGGHYRIHKQDLFDSLYAEGEPVRKEAI